MFASENLVSGDGFGSPVPRQPSHHYAQLDLEFLTDVESTTTITIPVTMDIGSNNSRVRSMTLSASLRIVVTWYVFFFIILYIKKPYLDLEKILSCG